MRKRSIAAMAATGIFGLSLVVGAGTPLADTDTPKYGGSLEVGTVYVTISALSWDAQDFNWKHNHDTGQFYEQLFAADLSKSVKNGGPHPFYADAWLPSDAIRGELAESWEWKENPLRVEIKLRKPDWTIEPRLWLPTSWDEGSIKWGSTGFRYTRRISRKQIIGDLVHVTRAIRRFSVDSENT